MPCYFKGEIVYLSLVNDCLSRMTSLMSTICCIRIWPTVLARAVPRPGLWRKHTATLLCFPGWNTSPGLRAAGCMQADVRAICACLVPALCRHCMGNWEAKTSCECPFQLSLIGCGLSIRHFMKTLRSVPAALLHGQTGDDLSHRLRRDGPPHCHNQPHQSPRSAWMQKGWSAANKTLSVKSWSWRYHKC